VIGATWYLREALAKIAQDMLAGAQPRNQIFPSPASARPTSSGREIVGWVSFTWGGTGVGNLITLT
jgi:hypothetical protein